MHGRHDASLAIVSMSRFAIDDPQNVYASFKANADSAAKVGGTSKRHSARKHGNKIPITHGRMGFQPVDLVLTDWKPMLRKN